MEDHGACNRLHDWTDGALIVVHFAIGSKPSPIESGSLIYVLDPHWLVDYLAALPDYRKAKKEWDAYCKKNPEKTRNYSNEDWERTYLPGYQGISLPETPLLWDSPHVSRRIAAQRSRFMIFGMNYRWLVELAEKKNSHLQ